MYEALEAEQAVIACLIQRSESVEDTLDLLSPEMFEVSVLGGMYFEYRKAFDDRRDLTMVELKQNLQTQYTEEEINEALRNCVASSAMAYQIRNYAEVVARHYKKTTVDAIFSRTELQDATIDRQIESLISDLESLQGGDTSDGCTVADLVDQFSGDYFTDKEKNLIFLGVEQIDSLTGGFEGGDIILLGARPGCGKSSLAMQWAELIAQQGEKVAYYNLEMQRAAVYERFVAAKSGIEIQRIRRATTFHNDEGELYSAANEELRKQTNITIYNGSKRVSDIRNDVRKTKPSVVIIDYLQLIQVSDRYHGNRAAEVGEISHSLKAIAMDYDVKLICLVQLNRAIESRRDHKPMLSDIRESGDLEQDASIVMFLYDTNETDKSEKCLDVAKSRQGQTGSVPLVFEGARLRFELAENVAPFGG